MEGHKKRPGEEERIKERDGGASEKERNSKEKQKKTAETQWRGI